MLKTQAYSTRYDYAGPYKSRERAQNVLESMFAEGEVSPGEFPVIERRDH